MGKEEGWKKKMNDKPRSRGGVSSPPWYRQQGGALSTENSD